MINKLILLGRLGQDPEQITFQNGNAIAKTSIATEESYRDKNGEWKSITEWTELEVGGNQVERFMNLRKGDLVFIEGTKRTDVVKDNRYTKCRVDYFRVVVSNEAKSPTQAAPKKQQKDVFDDIPF